MLLENSIGPSRSRRWEVYGTAGGRPPDGAQRAPAGVRVQLLPRPLRPASRRAVKGWFGWPFHAAGAVALSPKTETAPAPYPIHHQERYVTTHTLNPQTSNAADVEIVSFGYLHGEPPAAHLTLDLRQHFRDPHVSPELRYLTAHDAPVRQAVMGTPGIPALLDATAAAVHAFLAGPSGDRPFVVADGCAGGRHRAATFAMALADLLRADGLTVTLHHRDLSKPVVER